MSDRPATKLAAQILRPTKYPATAGNPTYEFMRDDDCDGVVCE